jgi:hypothetical protein
VTWWNLIAMLVAASGGFLVGLSYGLGKVEEQVQMTSNVVLSIVAVTMEMTYGEEWFEAFLDEAQTVINEYPDLIEKRTKDMMVRQLFRVRLDAVMEKYKE